GHVGFTLGLFTLLNKGERYLSYKKMLALSVAALSPDILDRSIHLIRPKYPTHGIFHSLPFYIVLLPIAFFVFRKAFIYLSIMTANVIFDFVNSDLRSFVYPFNNKINKFKVFDFPALLDHWPQTIGYKLPSGHYLVFEAVGMLLVVLIVSKRLIGYNKSLTGIQEPEARSQNEQRKG
ncbi:MAG: hypothetical protein GXP46_08910, partial [Deferribacteres bacterium]|nr:hypothetical protein [Deferribacteres bacterium]